MKEHSIPPAVLDRFIVRTATAEERKAVVRHLLAGCGFCRQYLHGFWPRLKAGNVVPIQKPDYGQAFERAEQAIGSLTVTNSSWELLAELDSHPQERQELLVRNHRRYWRLELCDQLIVAASQERFGSTRQLVHRARLAVLVAKNLKPEAGKGSATVEDHRARAWIELANSLRISGDFPGADKAYLTAQEHLGSGTGELALKARFLNKLASLRFDQRRFGTALQVSRQAAGIWRNLHNRRELARSLMSTAMATGEAGYPEAALRVLSEAESLIDPGTDSQLTEFIRHNSIRFLSESGATRTALGLYENMRPFYVKAAAPLILGRGLWLEGQLLSAAGEFETALPLLAAARREFLQQESPFEAALISLDLASALGKLGRRQEMRRLAATALQEMVARRVRREALAALILLRS